jgi:hypothetical protein
LPVAVADPLNQRYNRVPSAHVHDGQSRSGLSWPA